MMEAREPAPAGHRDGEGPTIPFVFVPHGDPLPAEWMNRHPGWVRIPAVMVPRGSLPPPGSLARPSQPPPPPGRARTVASAGTGGAPRHPPRPGAPPAPDRGGTNHLAALRNAWKAMDEAPTTVPVLLAAWRPAPAPPAASALGSAGWPATSGAPPLVLVSGSPDDPLVPRLFVPPLPGREGLDGPETSLREREEEDQGSPPRNPTGLEMPTPPGFGAGFPHFDEAPATPSPRPGTPAHPTETSEPSPAAPRDAPPTPAPGEATPSFPKGDRNRGLLFGNASTDGHQAREVARKTYPEVAQAGIKWRAHHVIPVASARRNAVVANAAGRGGWQMDGKDNLIALPYDKPAQEELAREHDGKPGIKLPYHNSGHPDEINDVDQRLRDIRRDLGPEDSPTYDQRARDKLEQLDRELREKIKRKDRVTQNDQPRIQFPV